MNIPDEDLRKGYYHLLQHQDGYLLALDAIHPDLVESFELTGTITTGLNSSGNETYQLTEFGRELADTMYKTLTANMIYDYLIQNC